MTLVDTNVLADILTNDPTWFDWSAGALERCGQEGPLFINEIVYAELSVRAVGQGELDRSLEGLSMQFDRTPLPALYLAGQAFGRYRDAGGTRSGVLPDFFIGAHAHVARVPILTRDTRRYRRYFPDVTLITP